MHPSTQGERHIRLAGTHLSLVRSCTAKLPQDVSKDAIFLLNAQYRNIVRNHVVHCENISQLDIQRRLDFGIEVIELANVKLRLRVRYVNHYLC